MRVSVRVSEPVTEESDIRKLTCNNRKIWLFGQQNSAGDITSSYFANNNATFGGAIFRGTSSGNVDNNVFNANSASSDGGAIYDSHVKVGPFTSMHSLAHICACGPKDRTGHLNAIQGFHLNKSLCAPSTHISMLVHLC